MDLIELFPVLFEIADSDRRTFLESDDSLYIHAHEANVGIARVESFEHGAVDELRIALDSRFYR
jgi:hypothetical protein